MLYKKSPFFRGEWRKRARKITIAIHVFDEAPLRKSRNFYMLNLFGMYNKGYEFFNHFEQ